MIPVARPAQNWFTAAVHGEWTKARTLGSTWWTLVLAVVLTVGLSCGFSALAPEVAPGAEAASVTFSGVAFGQFALMVFGALSITGEYGNGMVRTSLTATPRRGRYLAAKAAVVAGLALATSALITIAAFVLTQLIGRVPPASLGDPGVVRILLGGTAYLTLVAVLSLAAAVLLRSQVLTLGILMPFFFLVSPVLSGMHQLAPVARFLPDQAGLQMMAAQPEAGALAPAVGATVMVTWAVLAMGATYAAFRRRDA